MSDESLPAGSPYADYPGPLMETLRRSYRERRPGSWHLANGFCGDKESPDTLSFSQVVDRLGPACMESLRRIYMRALPIPNLWAQVGTIRECWPPGTSEGFFFNTKTADVMRRILVQSPFFCGDLPPGQSMHQTGEHGQTRQCFRELGQVGKPGLHICLVTPGTEDADGGAHNFHIDFHQLGKAKTLLCSCWYAGLNRHFGDVGEWIVDKFIGQLEAKINAKAATYGPLGTYAAQRLSESYKAELKAWLLRQLLDKSDAFDVLEGSIDNPPTPSDLFGKATTPIIHEALREFKTWYMLTV